LVYAFVAAGVPGGGRMQETSASGNLKRRRRQLIRVLIAAAAFIFIIIPAALLTGLWITERQKRAERPPRVEVPNVVGKDYRSGQAMLEAKGLKMQINGTRWDQNQPVGVIIDQNPPAGESVEVGLSVGVSVGGNPGQQFNLPQRR
jgi:beta-lactam-binding protein with PASTA domain